MKFYLASSFELVNRVQKVADMLKKQGHEVTTEWWHRDFKEIMKNEDDELWYHHFKIQQISERNFKGIENADVLILVAGSEPRKFNGANIELGYALALGKQCYSIGKLERSAMYEPIKRREYLLEILNDCVQREEKP